MRKQTAVRAGGAENANKSPQSRGTGLQESLSWWYAALVFAGLLAVVIAVYQPAWNGGVLWDDEGHLTRQELRSLHGLWRIWFDVRATQQYYPLVHSMFWLLAMLWGSGTFAPHMLNLILHASSAFLLVLILRRLEIPGALLAGVIFALHPVEVESVAWMAEMKNALSGTLYFGAGLVYLKFDRERKPWLYSAALALFILALLSKTVTATLPAGLLVVFWWQRGRLSWQRDVMPLIPFFGIGLAASAFTSWMERTYIAAGTTPVSLTFLERALVAGRAIVFYAGKLIWPSNLIFMYPRWHIDVLSWRQYLYPAGVLVVLAVLWKIRGRSRAPLAGFMFFAVTLSPALGFVDVFPFKYSFVSDHFQYLGSVGVIALVAAALAQLAERWIPGQTHLTEVMLILVVGAPLAFMSSAQSRQYTDAKTQYLVTLERNPESWLAHTNLALIELQESPPNQEDAIRHFEAAFRIEPNEPLVLNNIGWSLRQMNRQQDAIVVHQRATELAPNYAEAYQNLGADLMMLDRLPEAESAYRTALRLNSRLPGLHYDFGVVLGRLGREDEALREFEAAVETDPRDADGWVMLGDSFMRAGRLREAIARYQEAVEIRPDDGAARDSLGFALMRAGRLDDAVAQFREALRLRPDDAEAETNLRQALAVRGE